MLQTQENNMLLMSTREEHKHTCWFALDMEFNYLVSGWEATHCRSARALHTLLDWCAVRVGGLIDG